MPHRHTVRYCLKVAAIFVALLLPLRGRAQTLITSDSLLNSGSPVTITYNAPGTSGPVGNVYSSSSPLVSDNFSGRNYAYLGSNWTGCGYDGGNYSKLVILNNEAGGSGYYSQDCALYTGYGAFPNNQYATATIVGTPAGSQQTAIELRGNATSSTNEAYIACGWNAHDFPADYHYRIWSLAPGGTPVSLWLSKVTPATKDVVWCQVSGTSVTMKVNGSTLQTVTDTSGVASGYPGLYYMDSNGGAPSPRDVMFDNFAAGSIAVL
jgi:hypothetical protein